jgi:cob(I)alamin adenosyltransferase
MVSELLHNIPTQELARIEHELFRLEAAVSRQRDWIDWNEHRAQARYVSRYAHDIGGVARNVLREASSDSAEDN